MQRSSEREGGPGPGHSVWEGQWMRRLVGPAVDGWALLWCQGGFPEATVLGSERQGAARPLRPAWKRELCQGAGLSVPLFPLL